MLYELNIKQILVYILTKVDYDGRDVAVLGVFKDKAIADFELSLLDKEMHRLNERTVYIDPKSGVLYDVSLLGENFGNNTINDSKLTDADDDDYRNHVIERLKNKLSDAEKALLNIK